MVQLELLDKWKFPAMSRRELLLAIAEKQGHYIQWATGCCEPGYDDKRVVLADWNSKTRYDAVNHCYITLNNIMPRIAKLFEKLGYAVEWEDEWGICDSCGKAVRTQPDSYSWKPYYWQSESDIVCGDCIKVDPIDYLAWLSGNPKRCVSFDIDLAKYGYVLHSADYESGLCVGQNADPVKIAKQLRSEGITDFIFKHDSSGQFDINFSVWIRKPSED